MSSSSTAHDGPRTAPEARRSAARIEDVGADAATAACSASTRAQRHGNRASVDSSLHGCAAGLGGGASGCGGGGGGASAAVMPNVVAANAAPAAALPPAQSMRYETLDSSLLSASQGGLSAGLAVMGTLSAVPMSLNATFLARALESDSGGVIVPDVATYLHKQPSAPYRDVVPTRSSRILSSVVVSAYRHEGVPLLGAYLTSPHVLPGALLADVQQEVGCLAVTGHIQIACTGCTLDLPAAHGWLCLAGHITILMQHTGYP